MSLAESVLASRPVREPTPAGATRRIAPALSALSFWSAIALPAAYLPLSVVGIESARGLFLGLVALHVLALIGGRSHRRAEG